MVVVVFVTDGVVVGVGGFVGVVVFEGGYVVVVVVFLGDVVVLGGWKKTFQRCDKDRTRLILVVTSCGRCHALHGCYNMLNMEKSLVNVSFRVFISWRVCLSI